MARRTTIDRHHLRLVDDDPLPLPLDRWYPIAASRDVGKQPRTVRRLGRTLVLWRDAHGSLVAQDARCPHRGADLGRGRVVSGELECPYHGFRFAPDGVCTAVPCEPDHAKIRRDLAVRRHDVREHRGLAWLWHGPGAAEEVSLPWFRELPATDRHAWDYATVWPLPQLRVMEGMLDLHHAPFAHRRYLGGIGKLLDPYEVTVAADTVHTQGTLRRTDQRPERGFTASVDARLPGLVHLRFGERMHGVVAVTPIDRESTWIFARYFVELPVLGKLVAAPGLWAEFALVQPDDRRMLASCSPRDPDVHGYKLVRADLGIAQWHKLFAAACTTAPAASDRASTTTPIAATPA
jgi:phenylpropionate dioxygenase-like ring-hydroxylating dioxygenase large terminal subunit